MADATTGSAGYVFSVLLGFAASQFTEWMNDRRTYRREKETRDIARRDALLERHNAIQRQTLLGLQDELSKQLFATTEVFSHRRTAHDGGTEWSKAIQPSDVSDRFMSANIQSDLLSVRVWNEEVRIQCKQLRLKMADVLIATSRDDADLLHRQAYELFLLTNERIGALLREMDCMDSKI